MRPIEDCYFYGILDTGYCEAGAMPRMLEQMAAGGVDIVQLRAKGWAEDRIEELTRELHPIAKALGLPFILNDYPEIAGRSGVEGAHVGVDDMTVAEARKLAGRNCLIGKSSHSLDQAAEGAAQGADYLGFGPLFATPTKPDYQPIGTEEIGEVHRRVSLPIFCIGGIKYENLPPILAAGARRVVIVSGLLLAPDPAAYARDCARLLHPTVREGLDAVREGMKAARRGIEAARHGVVTAREGIDAAREGFDAARRGSAAIRRGINAMRRGSDAAKRGIDKD